MPLETATYIHDLVVSNPSHTDPLSAADSHMRLLKSTLQNTFPNFTDVALASTQAQIDQAAAGVISKGTSALPGLAVLADLGTGIFQPTAGQLGFSLSGAQVMLMGGTALITSLAFAAPAIATTGAYSGGTGQLVPIGAVLEWYDDVLPPEGGYCWANGQIIASANTVCPVLLARWGNRFGGNGTTTMGVPDRRDTVGVGKGGMGGTGARGLLTSLTHNVTNATIGSDTLTLIAANLPPYTPGGTNATSNVLIGGGATLGVINGSGAFAVNTGTGNNAYPTSVFGTLTAAPQTFTGTPQGGTSTPVNNVQPSTVCNYILRLA